jgi:hypothetical protein
MDYSQYIRQKQEAANVYLARSKTVDSSFLTMQIQQKAAYAGSIGSSLKNNPVYYQGDPVVNPISYDKGSCPKDHAYTQGFSSTNPLSQQEDRANQNAGGYLYNSPNYATSPPGMMLKNCTEVSTILSGGANLLVPSNGEPVYTKPYGMGPMPGQWPAYGYGQNTYFPKGDTPSPSTSCIVNKYLYSSG